MMTFNLFSTFAVIELNLREGAGWVLGGPCQGKHFEMWC